jgi:hypothetical protein
MPLLPPKTITLVRIAAQMASAANSRCVDPETTAGLNALNAADPVYDLLTGT